MLSHVLLLLRREASERAWALTIADHPHAGKATRRKTADRIKKLSRAGARRRSALDLVPRDVAVRMIGQSARLHGDKWVQSHRRRVAELEKAGISLEEAARRHTAWAKDELGNSFWRPKREPGARRKRRKPPPRGVDGG